MITMDDVKIHAIPLFGFEEFPFSKSITSRLQDILESGYNMSVESLKIVLKSLQSRLELISLESNVQFGTVEIVGLSTVQSCNIPKSIDTICSLFLKEKLKCSGFKHYIDLEYLKHIHYRRMLNSYLKYVIELISLIQTSLDLCQTMNYEQCGEYHKRIKEVNFKQKIVLMVEIVLVRLMMPEFDLEKLLSVNVRKNVKLIETIYSLCPLEKGHYWFSYEEFNKFKEVKSQKFSYANYTNMLELYFNRIVNLVLSGFRSLSPSKTNMLAQKLAYSLGILPKFDHTWQQSVTMYKGMQRYTKYNREAIVMHIDTSGDRYAVNTCMILDPNVDLIMITNYNSYRKLLGYISFWMGFAKTAFHKLNENGSVSRFTIFIGGSSQFLDEEYPDKSRNINELKTKKTEFEKSKKIQKEKLGVSIEKLKKEFYDNRMNKKTLEAVASEEEKLDSLERSIEEVSVNLHKSEQESKEEVATRIKSLRLDWDNNHFGNYTTVIVSDDGKNEKHTYYYQQLSNHQFQNKFHKDILKNQLSDKTSTDLALEQIAEYASVHNRRITRTVGEAHEMIKKSIDKNGAKYMKDTMTDKLKESLTDTAKNDISKYIDTLLQQNQLSQNKGTLVVISRGMNREELEQFRKTKYGGNNQITKEANLFDLCDKNAQGRDNNTGKKNLHHMMCKELKDFYEGLSNNYNIVFMGDPIYEHMGFPDDKKYEFSNKVIDATQIWNKEPFKNDKDGSTMCKQAYFILELQNKTKGVVQTGVRTGMMEYMAYFCVPTVGIEFQRDYEENRGTTGIDRLLNIASWIDEREPKGVKNALQTHVQTKKEKFVPWILLGSSIPYGASTKQHPLTSNNKYNESWEVFQNNAQKLYEYIFNTYQEYL